ncbi:hypothetical protein [Streptomyces sp. NPDC051662]|uniref:hypothetical protein n=1 Tax=Streptomyces sp. NPDC051662 TaxID=3154750 RepID=UPI003435DA69
MNSDTVTAIAATVIALGSLWVSYTQAKESRLHSHQSVRPVLQVRRFKERGDSKAGIEVINAGLGPAIVTKSVVRLDGEEIGQWNYHTQERVSESLSVRPEAFSLRPGAVVLAGQSTFLFALEEFSEDQHDWFWNLITRRLVIEIHYESLYGGEDFKAMSPAF